MTYKSGKPLVGDFELRRRRRVPDQFYKAGCKTKCKLGKPQKQKALKNRRNIRRLNGSAGLIMSKCYCKKIGMATSRSNQTRPAREGRLLRARCSEHRRMISGEELMENGQGPSKVTWRQVSLESNWLRSKKSGNRLGERDLRSKGKRHLEPNIEKAGRAAAHFSPLATTTSNRHANLV